MPETLAFLWLKGTDNSSLELAFTKGMYKGLPDVSSGNMAPLVKIPVLRDYKRVSDPQRTVLTK